MHTRTHKCTHAWPEHARRDAARLVTHPRGWTAGGWLRCWPWKWNSRRPWLRSWPLSGRHCAGCRSHRPRPRAARRGAARWLRRRLGCRRCFPWRRSAPAAAVASRTLPRAGSWPPLRTAGMPQRGWAGRRPAARRSSTARRAACQSLGPGRLCHPEACRISQAQHTQRARACGRAGARASAGARARVTVLQAGVQHVNGQTASRPVLQSRPPRHAFGSRLPGPTGSASRALARAAARNWPRSTRGRADGGSRRAAPENL